jgi:hypothetical protein
MSKDVDQKDANSAVAYEPVDQAMKMTMGKVRVIGPH